MTNQTLTVGSAPRPGKLYIVAGFGTQPHVLAHFRDHKGEYTEACWIPKGSVVMVLQRHGSLWQSRVLFNEKLCRIDTRFLTPAKH